MKLKVNAIAEQPTVPKTAEISSYNGKPMIVLSPGSKWPFQFGINKAKLIVEQFDHIKKFVETNGTSL